MTPSNPNVPAAGAASAGGIPQRPQESIPFREPVSPLRPSGPPRGPAAPVLPNRKPTVRVIHDARQGLPPARGVRAALALLLVTFAGLLATVPMGTWRWLLTDLPRSYEGTHVAEEFFTKPLPLVSTPAPPILQGAAAGLLLFLGIAIGRLHVIRYVVAAAVAFATLHCANLLLGAGFGWERLVLPALWAAYFICLSTQVTDPSMLGLFGFLLMVVACTGCHGDWFNWQNHQGFLDKWPSVRAFFADWGSEASWAVVLLLTALAVAMSRGRMIHFCNAILLLILAWFCIRQGSVVTQTFEFANVGVTKSIEVQGWRYVDTWRWVFAGELVLFSIILLHLALGMGAIALGFAIAWLAFGIHVDQRIERLLFSRHINDEIIGFMSGSSGGDPSRESRSSSGFERTIGLPTEGQPATKEVVPTRRRSAELQRADNIGVTVTTTWSVLTAVLAGLIGATGLRMLISNPNLRHWVLLLIWGGLGALVVWLTQLAPKQPTEAWIDWGLNWLTRFRAEAMIAIAWITFALAASWSLRERAQYLSWLYCGAICSLIGTAISLLGIYLLNAFAGFPALPVWVFVAIAAGQSALMWALLMHRNLGARHQQSVQPMA